MKKLFLVLTVILTVITSVIVNGAGYTTKPVPTNNSFRAYMSYKTITSRNSPQYKLQQRAATGNYGIRTVDGRYCIAVGSYYTTKIGTKIDIVMSNGNIINCILADCKADAHTDCTNRANSNGCVVEFIVDTNSLDSKCRKMGDMSYVPSGGLQGNIKALRIYDEVI